MNDETENVLVDDEDQHQDLAPDAIEHLSGKKPEKEFDDEYDEKKASDPVKKRISKLTKKWRMTESELEQERAEKEELRKRLEEIEKDHVETGAKQLDDREESIRERLKTAEEEADVVQVSQLHDELRKVDRERIRLEIRRQKPPEQTVPQAAQPKNNVRPQLSEAAEDWIADNAEWFTPEGDNYDARRARQAVNLSRNLKNQYGFEDDDPELYEMINQKLDEVGARGNRDTDERQQFDGNQRRGAANDMGRASSRSPRRSGKVLSRHDLENMGRYGFDPNNMEDRKNYLKYKGGAL